MGSEDRRGRWGIPTLALHIRIQHRENTEHESVTESHGKPTPPEQEQSDRARAGGGVLRASSSLLLSSLELGDTMFNEL